MHKMVISVVALLLLGFTQVVVAADSSSSSEKGQSGDGKGITVEDLGRGLKSAANNVEKEIPKAGSAIGNVFKKITSKGSEKSSSQESTKQNK